MTAENSTRKRWLVAGCILTIAASIGLCAFPLYAHLNGVAEAGFGVACTLVILMGLGATVAVFNVKRP